MVPEHTQESTHVKFLISTVILAVAKSLRTLEKNTPLPHWEGFESMITSLVWTLASFHQTWIQFIQPVIAVSWQRSAILASIAHRRRPSSNPFRPYCKVNWASPYCWLFCFVVALLSICIPYRRGSIFWNFTCFFPLKQWQNQPRQSLGTHPLAVLSCRKSSPASVFSSNKARPLLRVTWQSEWTPF